MKIIKYNVYLDGGTIEIETDNGVFCFDKRMRSNTKGRLYRGYPKKDNSNIIENSTELEKKLLEGLKSYKDEFYQGAIDYFIKSKEKN